MSEFTMTEELRLVARLLREAYAQQWRVVSASRRRERPRVTRAWGTGPQSLGTLTAQSRQVVLTVDGTLICRVPSTHPGNHGWGQTLYVSRVTAVRAINALCDEGLLPPSWHTAFAAGAAAVMAAGLGELEDVIADARMEIALTTHGLAALAEGMASGA